MELEKLQIAKAIESELQKLYVLQSELADKNNVINISVSNKNAGYDRVSSSRLKKEYLGECYNSLEKICRTMFTNEIDSFILSKEQQLKNL